MLVPSLRDLFELNEAISIRVLAYTNKVACYYVGLAGCYVNSIFNYH